MVTRRQFLKNSALLGAGLFLPKDLFRYYRPVVSVAQPTLDLTKVPKYQDPLLIPPAMPRIQEITGKHGEPVDYYEIAVRQFDEQILPVGLPKTTVWGYGPVSAHGVFNAPSFTIEATYNKPVRVKWINQLVDFDGNYLPHLLAVDPTLHWANPEGPRDMRPMFQTTPGPYKGPVPMVVHLHGAHVEEDSDGYAEAWFLPNAANIPADFFKVGSKYDQFKAEAEAHYGQAWTPGSAVFQYPNDQRATALWYHDHSVGMTRLNVYAGPAGFYLIRGGPDDLPKGDLPGPAPAPGDPAGTKYYEIPLAIQDRSFNADGSLFYPDTREFFDGYAGPYIPEQSDISPIWNPETFANTIMVNGKTWPKLEVEPRRYRFRILNGCNSRFLILKLVAEADQLTPRPVTPVMPFWQIGNEGGFLSKPVSQDQLLMTLAERADVIVDFTGLPQGTVVYMINEGPDSPFGGGVQGTDFPAADPATTGQVMKFIVNQTLTGTDNSLDPDPSKPNHLVLPAITPLPPAVRTRQISLNEVGSDILIDPTTGQPRAPREALLGILNADGTGHPLEWHDPITENPHVGDTEIWEIYNFTEDAHPIHIHLVHFEVLNREAIVAGTPRDPEPWETGVKDTVISYPQEITRIKATFDIPGLYAWHCHIVEHEDNEMMRPYYVEPYKTFLGVVSK